MSDQQDNSKKVKVDFSQTDGDLNKTREKIMALEAQSEEYLRGWQRARADYDNLKKETERNLQELRKYIKAEMILDVLPVYDHFKMAMAHIPLDQQEADWIQGINHIHREFADWLKSEGVEEIATKGQEFDPRYHEAVATEQSSEDEGQIIKEIKTGYKINDTILRPAQVIVSKPGNSTININQESQDSQTN